MIGFAPTSRDLLARDEAGGLDPMIKCTWAVESTATSNEVLAAIVVVVGAEARAR